MLDTVLGKVTLTIAAVTVLPFIFGAMIGPDWLFHAGALGMGIALVLAVGGVLQAVWSK